MDPSDCNQVQGINLKGCLYFIGKGNSKFSLSKWRVTSKIALHVCIEVFVESAHYHVYHIREGLLFLPFILKGLQKINPSFLKGCKMFWRESEGVDPKIRVIALQIYSLIM